MFYAMPSPEGPMPHPAHHRHSIRLPAYDYSTPAAYFVTICTDGRECVFGEIADGAMVLNECGEIVQQMWDNLPDHYPCVQLDQFVIMPNHVHGIIVITDDGHPAVGAGSPRPGFAGHGETGGATPPLRRPSLGNIVGYFKYQSTKHINTLRHTPGLPVWQRNYYEHVIRDDHDLAAIRDYIAANPARWMLARNHPDQCDTVRCMQRKEFNHGRRLES
jgi:REP element-mobilizing transposase RayT